MAGYLKYNGSYSPYEDQGLTDYGAYAPRVDYSAGSQPSAPSGGQSMGQLSEVAGSGLMMTGNPYLMGAGIGLQAVGTGLSAWGAYKASQQAEKQYELAKKAYEEEKARTAKLDAINEQQRGISNDLNWGQYAGNLEDKGMNTYGAYNRRIGR